jgi:ABC-type microcin C transport system permease subunit YejB
MQAGALATICFFITSVLIILYVYILNNYHVFTYHPVYSPILAILLWTIMMVMLLGLFLLIVEALFTSWR